MTGKGLPKSLETLYNRVAQLELDTQAVINGGIVLSVSPATLGSSAAAVNSAISGDGFTRDVTIQLLDSNGSLIKSNGTFSIAVAENTAGDGTAAIEESVTEITLVDGEATVTIEYSGTWAADDTCTFTITGGTVAGNTVSNKTSVDTLVA